MERLKTTSIGLQENHHGTTKIQLAQKRSSGYY